MRLNRFLAAAGLGSRRSCEELIRTGQVTVNGVLCETLATTVGPADVVKLGNRVLHAATPVTLLLNKPPGFICTAADEHDRQTVFDLLPPNFPRLFHVGRLDRDSEGLLILTNDGSLALKLTHPRYKVDKEYEVVLDHAFDVELTQKLLHGMNLEEGWAKAESVYKLAPNKLKVVLRQGMKRQIRLMFFALGYEVKKLMRVRIGPIEIQKMPLGSWRVLTQKEIEALLAEGAKTAASDTTPRRRTPKPRPFLRPDPKGGRRERAQGSERPERPLKPRRTSGPVEEIAFVPRAQRERAERAQPGAKPARKPVKAYASKPGGKPTSKSGREATPKSEPKPFAKFQHRRFGR